MKRNVLNLLLVYVCIALGSSVFAAGERKEEGVRQGLIGHWEFDDLTDGMLRDSADTGRDKRVPWVSRDAQRGTGCKDQCHGTTSWSIGNSSAAVG